MEKEKYNHFNSRDLILDDDFRAWIHGPTPEANQFWESWMSGHPSRRVEVDKARKVIQALRFKETEVTGKEVDSEWEKLHSLISVEEVAYEPLGRSKFTSIAIKVAAAAALVISLFFADRFLFRSGGGSAAQETITHKTKNGEQQDLRLPDGTQVRLNAGSTLFYPKAFTDTLREVILEGEAYFQVVGNKNAPFVIRSGKVTTRVIGTVFSISAYPDNREVRIAVVEGKVSVKTNQNAKANSVFLTKDEMVTFQEDLGELVVSNFEKDDLIAWKDGMLCFEKADFVQTIKKLERWYGVKIEVSKNKKLDPAWRFSGKFKDKPLEYILNVMSYPNRFSYRINENIVNLQ